MDYQYAIQLLESLAQTGMYLAGQCDRYFLCDLANAGYRKLISDVLVDHLEESGLIYCDGKYWYISDCGRARLEQQYETITA